MWSSRFQLRPRPARPKQNAWVDLSSRNLPWLSSARPHGRVSTIPTENYCPHGKSMSFEDSHGIPHKSIEYSPWGLSSAWGFPWDSLWGSGPMAWGSPHRGIPHGYSLGEFPPGIPHGGFQSGTGVVWSCFQFPFPTVTNLPPAPLAIFPTPNVLHSLGAAWGHCQSTSAQRTPAS